MATPKFDANMWYQLWAGDDSKQSYVGTATYTKSGTMGAVYFNTTDTSATSQQWQIFQINSTTWALRSAEAGSNVYMGSEIATDETTEGQTRPCMSRGDVADASALWTFGPWGDGTWYLTNAVNGTNYHLNRKGTGTMAMSPNITAPQDGQRWQWKSISAINNAQFSTIGLKGVTIATESTSSTSASTSASTASSITPSASASSSSTPSPNNSSSSKGLSSGAQAAIGATIGGIALIALIVLGLMFFKRRKQQHAHPYELPLNDTYYDQNTKYELQQDAHLVEAPLNQAPAELTGDTTVSQQYKDHARAPSK